MKRTWTISLVIDGWAGLRTALALSAGQADPAGPAKIQFNRDIRPILSENCLACHGPDPAARKAGIASTSKTGFSANAKRAASPSSKATPRPASSTSGS